jgi:hypothetical protein
MTSINNQLAPRFAGVHNPATGRIYYLVLEQDSKIRREYFTYHIKAKSGYKPLFYNKYNYFDLTNQGTSI